MRSNAVTPTFNCTISHLVMQVVLDVWRFGEKFQKENFRVEQERPIRDIEQIDLDLS